MQCGGVRAGVIPLCSALVRQLLRNCAQVQVPRFRREIDQLKTVQARATNTVGKLKREIYTETLKELIIWPGEEKVKRASDYYLRYSEGVMGKPDRLTAGQQKD